MTCKNCGENNPPAKKCCQSCGNVLEGYTINNVTGQYGYRNSDGTFTVEKYTIQDLADGKCAVVNDGTLAELTHVLKIAFPYMTNSIKGLCRFYLGTDNLCFCSNDTDLPTQSVKDFLPKSPSPAESLKQQIDRITKEAEDKIQQIVLDHHQQTGVMVSIRLEYQELSGKTLMPIITLYSTL